MRKNSLLDAKNFANFAKIKKKLTIVSFLITISDFFCSAEIFSTYLHQSRADFPVILAAQLLFVFFVRREEFAFCFRPFPEVTLLARRR